MMDKDTYPIFINSYEGTPVATITILDESLVELLASFEELVVSRCFRAELNKDKELVSLHSMSVPAQAKEADDVQTDASPGGGTEPTIEREDSMGRSG